MGYSQVKLSWMHMNLVIVFILCIVYSAWLVKLSYWLLKFFFLYQDNFGPNCNITMANKSMLILFVLNMFLFRLIVKMVVMNLQADALL